MAVLLAIVIAAQAAAVTAAPAQRTSTARSLGRAGFAYLGGLRTFAAAVIWNRIDPQFHGYFTGVPLSDQIFMLPKLRMVTLLDPTFAEAYYISSYIVFKHSSPEAGLAIAREGVAANPDAGRLKANLVQLLFVADRVGNRTEIMRAIDGVLDSDTKWDDPEAQFEGYGIAMNALESFGDAARAGRVKRQLDAWRAEGVGQGDHDHDGDGKQDH
jgi:hypothetical protein